MPIRPSISIGATVAVECGEGRFHYFEQNYRRKITVIFLHGLSYLGHDEPLTFIAIKGGLYFLWRGRYTVNIKNELLTHRSRC